MRMTAIACTLLLAACAAEPREADVAMSDSAGVTVVSNVQQRPLWRRDARWLLASNPSIQVGNVRGNPEHQLYRVAHSTRLADGGIAVANTGFGDIRIFDGQGFYSRTLTLSADAAEKAPPLRLHEPAPGELIVYQGDRTFAHFRGGEASPSRAQLQPPPEGLEQVEPIGTFADGSFLFRGLYPWDDAATGVGRRRARLLHYAADGRLLGSVGEVDGDAVLFAERGAYIFAPTAAIAAGDSTVWYGDGEHYELREIARDGRLLRVVRLDRPGAPVLQADRAAYRSAVSRQVEGTPRAETMGATLDSSVFADTFPVFDQIVVDALGNVWVRSYQWFDLGSGKGWSVFDPEGRYLGEVTTPSILEIHEIGADFVLGRMADRAGREAVYIFRLEKPGTQARPGEGADGDSAASPPS